MDATVLLSNPNVDYQTLSALNEPVMYSACFAMLGLIVLIAVIYILCNAVFGKSKSKNYREVITDMYVAGTIRKFAAEDKLDLEAEYKNFKKWERKDKLKYHELDSAVEDNLKEKVTAKAEKEIDTIK